MNQPARLFYAGLDIKSEPIYWLPTVQSSQPLSSMTNLDT